MLEGVELSKLCDYSFVEESAQWANIFTSLFVNKYEKVTEKFLIKNNPLYEWAKNLDFIDSSLPYFYDKFVQQYSK